MLLVHTAQISDRLCEAAYVGYFKAGYEMAHSIGRLYCDIQIFSEADFINCG